MKFIQQTNINGGIILLPKEIARKARRK